MAPTSPRGRPALWAVGLTFAFAALALGRDRAVEVQGPSGPGGRTGLDPGRGRSASTPLEIPAAGWKDILLRVWQDIGDNRIIVIGAGVTFYIVLAVFPAITALVALYGMFTDPASINSHLDSLAGVLPGGAIDVIRQQITRLAAQHQSTLGIASALGILVSLWSANAGMKSIFDALNLVYGEPEKRGFIRLNAVSLLFTLCGMALILVALGSTVVVPFVVGQMGLSGTGETLIQIGRWPALLVVLALALAVLFRYGPSRREPRWRWITWGSAFAALAWLAASLLFSFYAANFGSYNKTYGSLGAIIGFMTWIWLSVIVILVGAELDAEMEHQTARDTTEGRARPLGSRGARMADTVGRRMA